jgi:hypothetical protein
MIQEHLTIGAISLCQIIAIKGNNITFPFEGHYSKILKRKHAGHIFYYPIHNSMPASLTVQNVD